MKHGIAMTAVVLVAAATAAADGFIVPIRPDLPVRGSWAVKEHDVKMTVRDQVVSVTVNQQFVNTGGRDVEVEYLFPIPPDAAVSSMTLLVDGKELPGKLMDAKEARKAYEEIVRRKKDPALLEYVGFGLYKTSAFPLQAGKPASVITRYEAVARKDYETVEVFYPLNTEKFSAKKIDEVSVKVDIKADGPVTPVYSPTHEVDVKHDKDDPSRVTVTYQAKDVLPDSDFVVYYRVAKQEVGATVLSHCNEKGEGYYLVLVSPNPKHVQGQLASKDLVIVLDRSASMAQDRKLDQAKEALRYVLSSLRTEDRFNVVSFSDSIETFFAKLVDATDKNTRDALEQLDRVDPSGGTNIAEALTTALDLFEAGPRPRYVLFLTDGLPTVGERDEAKILEKVGKANDQKVRVVALGVGFDVNVRLLDRLVRDHRGFSDYVKPKEPLEQKISAVYNKIKRPVMTDVKLAFRDLKTSQTYPRTVPDLFDGGQIVSVGRYEGGGKTTLTVSGTLDGREQTLSYPVTLGEEPAGSRNKFVERLWAVRRIGFLLDEIQLHGENEELVKEVTRLSLDYGIITPYTAFLADESVPLRDRERLHQHAEGAARGLSRSYTGAQGQADAVNRQMLNEAARAPAPAGVPASGPDAAGNIVLGYKSGADYEAQKKEQLDTVQNVGNQALYRRGSTWVTPETAQLDRQKDAAQIRTVERFSEEYFKLVERNSVHENQLLASQRAGEQLLVKLRGQVYLIE